MFYVKELLVAEPFPHLIPSEGVCPPPSFRPAVAVPSSAQLPAERSPPSCGSTYRAGSTSPLGSGGLPKTGLKVAGFCAFIRRAARGTELPTPRTATRRFRRFFSERSRKAGRDSERSAVPSLPFPSRPAPSRALAAAPRCPPPPRRSLRAGGGRPREARREGPCAAAATLLFKSLGCKAALRLISAT